MQQGVPVNTDTGETNLRKINMMATCESNMPSSLAATSDGSSKYYGRNDQR